MAAEIKRKKVSQSYYVTNISRDIPVKRKIFRFILRYIIPTLYISIALFVTCFMTYLISFSNNQFMFGKALVSFVAFSLIFGLIAAFFGGKWFAYISSIEDK